MDYYIVAILTGTLFLIIGFYSLRDRIIFINTGIEADATVIRIEVVIKQPDSENGKYTSYIPHFRIVTHHEEEVFFVYGTSGTWGKWSIGDQIKVVYNETYPGDVVVRTFWGSYGKSILLLSAGFIPFIIGTLHFLLK